jgi:hypothetical protein
MTAPKMNIQQPKPAARPIVMILALDSGLVLKPQILNKKTQTLNDKFQ